MFYQHNNNKLHFFFTNDGIMVYFGHVQKKYFLITKKDRKIKIMLSKKNMKFRQHCNFFENRLSKNIFFLITFDCKLLDTTLFEKQNVITHTSIFLGRRAPLRSLTSDVKSGVSSYKTRCLSSFLSRFF